MDEKDFILFNKEGLNNNNYKIYNKINIIINNDKITLRNKQRKIEKLMNVFLLKKQENIWELNPLWKNTIINSFDKELILFNKVYNSLEYNKQIYKNNYFIIIYKKFNYIELFSLIIYSFLDKLNNNFYKQKSELIGFISDNLINYYSHIFKFIYLEENINFYLFKDDFDNNFNLKNFFNSLILKYKSINKDFVLTYDIVILEYLKQKYSNKDIDKRYKIYKNTIENFNKNFFNDLIKSNELKIRLTKYIHIIFDLLNDDIFKSFLGNIGNKSYDYMYLSNFKIFNYLNNTHYLLSQIPMIYEPNDWNKLGKKGGFLLNKKNNILFLTKNLTNGYSKIQYNKFFIDSINISQKKKYKINKFYLNFIQTPFFKKNNNILSKNELDNLYYKMCKLKKKIENINIYDYLKEYKSLISSNLYKKSNFDDRNKEIEKLKNYFQINSECLDNYNELFNIYKEYYKFYNYNNEYDFVIKISNILINHYLYIPNKTDFRGRFYPIGRILHRASGIYKYLLIDENDFTDFSIDRENMLKLLVEYIVMLYKPFDKFYKKDLINWFDKNILEPLKKFNKSNLEIFDFLNNFILNKSNIQLKFINNNKINDNYKYYFFNLVNKASNKNLFLLSLLEYFKIKSKISDISYLSIDFDQSNSGPMIYSILSKDKTMAKLTNLFYNNGHKEDLYVDFLNIFKNNIDKVEGFDKKYLNIFKRKNFSKLLLMPIFYNMGDKGIKNLIKNIFKENNIYNEKKYYNIKKDLIKNLVVYIKDLLNKNYKNTIKFQKNLVEICKILTDKNISINFYTLDGSYIQYKYIKLNYCYNFIKKSKNQKKKTYKLLLPIEFNKLDNKHYLTFPPNFIQSIDASLCRIIINVLYNISNIIVEPLHDSFRIPFKYIKLLENTIKYCYIYVFFNNYFNKYKIGLNLLNNNIEKNSLYYDNYKKYFYYNKIKKNYNIVYDYFINTLGVDLETKNLILKIFDENIFSEDFLDEEIDKILNSEFLFYF